MRKKLLILLSLFLTAEVALGEPSLCDKVRLDSPPKDAEMLGRAASHQLRMTGSKVSKTYRFEQWEILYVEPQEADPAYLFYMGPVSPRNFKGLWAGVALSSEAEDIFVWTKKNIKGIPEQLAACFAFKIVQVR